MAPSTDIIIPVFNQPDETEQCLESVMRYTYDYALIIIDNGSEKPTRKILERLQVFCNPRLRVIRNEENLGFVKAINQGMKASIAPYVCWLNNDTVVTVGWLDRMRETMVLHEPQKCGFVMPKSTFHVNPQIFQSARLGRDVQLPTILGFCVLIDRRVIDDIGFLDERFSEGYGYDETDYFRRAQERGWTAWLSAKAFVYHRAFSIFDAVYPRQLEELYKRNRKLYEEKWGSKDAGS